MKNLLIIICSSFVSLGFCQSNSSQYNCENEFKSADLKMSICMDSSWSQSAKGPWTIFSKDDMKISIYMEPIQKVEPLETKVKNTIKKDLSDTDYFGMELIKKEKIKIDEIEAFLVVMHHPEKNTENRMQTNNTTFTYYYVYKGNNYAINCSCYKNDCSKHEAFMSEFVSKVRMTK